MTCRIRRSKKHAPSHTVQQHSFVTSTLRRFAGSCKDDDIACAWEEVLGSKAQGNGIRRSKIYTPAYTAEQHSFIAYTLRKFADSLEGNASSEGPSPLTKAIRMYAAKKIPSNEMAKEREIPSWPPANCENPSVPQTLNEDDDHPNSICPNGTIHTFDCHFSVCAAHLIPPQVERYSQTNLHEPHESKIFAALMLTARPNDLFVDVGAAIGYFAALALKVNPRALVYAFDPLIEFKMKLGTNIWLNFGETDGTTSRICIDGRAMSNRDGGKDWIGDDYGGQIKTKVEKDGFGEIVGGNEVETVRLDTVFISVSLPSFTSSPTNYSHPPAFTHLPSFYLSWPRPMTGNRSMVLGGIGTHGIAPV